MEITMIRSLTGRTTTVALACLFVLQQAPAVLLAQQAPTTQTFIDGAKTPERIPDWYRWERLLSRAGEAVLARDLPNSQFLAHTLFLVNIDLAELRKQGELHQDRKKAHDAR